MLLFGLFGFSLLTGEEIGSLLVKLDNVYILLEILLLDPIDVPLFTIGFPLTEEITTV